jgi:hypothetical protein
MALMLIIAGACLALGGLLGLLSGFDAMTTERGAAATIAGVTALAGGLISIGLGCVVARLSQILAAYEDDSEERIAAALNADVPEKSIPVTAPIVAVQPEVEAKPAAEPIAVEAPKVEAAQITAQPVEGDTLLRNPLNQRREAEAVETESKSKQSTASRLLSRLGRNKGTLATGAAAGATIAGAAVALGAARQPEPKDKKPADGPATFDRQKTDNPVLVEAEPVLAAIETSSEDETSSEPDFTPDPLIASENLEIELANALSEDLEPAQSEEIKADAIPEPVPPPKPARGRRKFSEMLETKPAPPVEIADVAAESAEPPAEMPEEVETVVEAVVETSDVEPEEADAERETSDVGPDTTASAANEETEDLSVKSAELNDEPDQITAQTPAVLGRYVRDGHTYTLYADGSVDALTEAGLKRYASMEELRKELTKP